MNALDTHDHQPTRKAGFPPAPPEAHQRAVPNNSNKLQATMDDQFGFDFADDVPTFQPDAPGTWDRIAYTAQQYPGVLQRADGALRALTGPSRALFSLGLAEAHAEHADAASRRNGLEGAFTLHIERLRAEPEELVALVDHINAHAGTTVGDRAYKVRPGSHQSMRLAMHVDQLGTLDVHLSANGTWIAFTLGRSAFFRDSYLDGRPLVRLSHAVFGPAYCADKIGTSDRQRPAVPTFIHAGREYVNTGGWSHHAYAEIDGWSIRPLSDWHGETYNNREQCAAWDDGSLERGDRRGLVVMVRGQACVLESESVFFDDDVKRLPLYVPGPEGASTDDEEPEDDAGGDCEEA